MAELIPAEFVFSQSNLQTFSHCRRQFLLRFVKRLVLPAQLVSDQSYVRDREAGVRFHRLVHQYFLGFETPLLIQVAAADPDQRVLTWLEAFLSSPFASLEGHLQPETLFTTLLRDRPLSAKFDLLQINERTLKIYDWKTSRRLPNVSVLKKKVQSMVYPMVISRVLAVRDEMVNLESLTMVYWEANYPDQPMEIVSRQEDWEAFESNITALIELILSLKEEEFIKTPEVRRCSWCEYRSYCYRGKTAGSLEENLEDSFLDDGIKIPGEILDPWG